MCGRPYERAGENFHHINEEDWPISPLYLSELREIGEANYLQSLIDAKQIDDLFIEFNRFVI